MRKNDPMETGDRQQGDYRNVVHALTRASSGSGKSRFDPVHDSVPNFTYNSSRDGATLTKSTDYTGCGLG